MIKNKINFKIENNQFKSIQIDKNNIKKSKKKKYSNKLDNILIKEHCKNILNIPLQDQINEKLFDIFYKIDSLKFSKNRPLSIIDLENDYNQYINIEKMKLINNKDILKLNFRNNYNYILFYVNDLYYCITNIFNHDYYLMINKNDVYNIFYKDQNEVINYLAEQNQINNDNFYNDLIYFHKKDNIDFLFISEIWLNCENNNYNQKKINEIKKQISDYNLMDISEFNVNDYEY